MAKEQLDAFIAKLQGDQELLQAFTNAADLGSALAIAKEAGYDLSLPELLRYQAEQTLELGDDELEQVAGGITPVTATMFIVTAGKITAVGATVLGGMAIVVGTCSNSEV
jgi:predicted ribosomally synthesized peptide with nif11-like leader